MVRSPRAVGSVGRRRRPPRWRVRARLAEEVRLPRSCSQAATVRPPQPTGLSPHPTWGRDSPARAVAISVIAAAPVEARRPVNPPWGAQVRSTNWLRGAERCRTDDFGPGTESQGHRFEQEARDHDARPHRPDRSPFQRPRGRSDAVVSGGARARARRALLADDGAGRRAASRNAPDRRRPGRRRAVLHGAPRAEGPQPRAQRAGGAHDREQRLGSRGSTWSSRAGRSG